MPKQCRSLPFRGTDNVKLLPLTLAGGTIYDLKVTLNAPGGTLRTARHYKVGAVQPSVELGIDGNGVHYFESGNILQINADVSPVAVVVSVDDRSGPGEVVSQATSTDYTVIDGSGNILTSATGASVSTSSPVTIGFSRTVGFVDPYSVITLANGHTNVVKTTGSDNGFYVKDCNPRPEPFHITLEPENAVNEVGTDHKVTAKVTGTAGVGFPNNVPVPGVLVVFQITSGPNAGASGTCSVNADCRTDNDGKVSWTYTGSGGVGFDTIKAAFDDGAGFPNIDDEVSKEWKNPPTPARTIGFWKNHPDLIAELLPIGALTQTKIDQIFNNTSAKDAKDALKAQRLAAILNIANGADRFVLTGIDILEDAIIPAKTLFLQGHPEPLTGRHKDGHREEALDLKDLLDQFNNSGE